MSDGDQRERLHAVIVDARGGALKIPGLARWIAAVAPSRARGLVSIAIVSDARVRALNRRYRRKDYASDVLSFPNVAWTGRGGGTGRTGRTLQPSAPFLGDIVIARGVARRQARDAGHSELTELRVLALHGLLHLLGYDHEHDDGRMRRLEERLRRKGGLQEGLIARAHQPSAISHQRSAIHHSPSVRRR